MFSIRIPLIDRANKPNGVMVQFNKKTPNPLPRVGEYIFVLPNICLKVEKITYDGNALKWVNFELEPLSTEYRSALEMKPRKKIYGGWSWNNGASYSDYENFEEGGL
jgi:hypothetical protein